MGVSFLFPHGKPRAVTLGYDDGQGFDRRLVSILNEYNLKATFFLNSSVLGDENFLTPDEIPELFAGHEVGIHTKTHPYLDSIPIEAVIDEIVEDRRCLERLVGYPVKGMSYPFGVFNEEITKVLSSAGIEYSRTVISTFNFNIPQNFLTWHPTCHHNQNLMDITKRFLQEPMYKNHLKLLYVWGHSFEFDRQNNWSVIEDFCKFISKDSSVWFATNIEIVRYIKALKMLEFSANLELVYNPLAQSVWLDVDGKVIEVKGGELICLR